MTAISATLGSDFAFLATDTLVIEGGRPARASKLVVVPHLGVALAVQGVILMRDAMAAELANSQACCWAEVMHDASKAAGIAVAHARTCGLPTDMRLLVIGWDGGPAGFYIDSSAGHIDPTPMPAMGNVVVPLPAAALGRCWDAALRSPAHALNLARAAFQAAQAESLPCGGAIQAATIKGGGITVTTIAAEADRAG